MNLNITPIDKIPNELAAIDSYLNITMSEEVQENVVAKMGYISIHSMKVTKDADGNVSKKSEE